MIKFINYKTRIIILLMAILTVFSTMALATGWQWMSAQRVTALVNEGSGMWIVDVRSEAAFTEGHIEGAVNIPASIMATKRLPHGKIIVLVDDSLGLRYGRESAEVLLKNGHDKVFILEGGMPAWLGEGHPVAGKGNRQTIRSIKPDDLAWARENRIPLRIFDLRDKGEQAKGPIAQGQPVEGKTLAERLGKVKNLMTGNGKKGLAARLEKPVTTILVFPESTDPRPTLERSFSGLPGDVRFLEGGYAAWAAKPDKHVSTVGACPTCPGAASGGKK